MAGLLDSLDDPAVVGLLSAGLRMMSTPGPFGQVLGQAGMGALGDMNAAKDSLQKRKLQEQQMKAADIQMLLHQQQLADMQRQSQQQTQAQEYLRSLPSPQMAAAQGALAGGGGPTIANAAKMPAVDPAQAMAFNLMQHGLMPAADYAKMLQKDETPLMLPEGTTAVDRKTFKPLATGGNKQTTEQKDYEQARAQGFKGTLLDYQTALRNAGAMKSQVMVNSYTPASEQAQKEFMSGVRARYDQLQSAPSLMDNIEKAKALVPTAKGFMGPGGESKLEIAKFFNQNLGTHIMPQEVKDAEELRSRLFVQVMENLKKMDASPSQYQQMVMQDAFGKLGTDPNAIPQILDVFGNIVRQKVAIHNQEVKGSIQRGIKFPYDPVINLPPPGAADVRKRADAIIGG